jgi:exosortase A
MKSTDLAYAEVHAAEATGATGSPRMPWILAGAVLLATFALHAASFGELLSVWYRSVSYNHCFLVFPVALWLMWRDRGSLAQVSIAPWAPGIVVLGGLGACWLAGSVASINSLRDFAVVATVPVLAVTLLGTGFGRVMAFPLAFLMFAWPFGEILIPTFIDRTADFTVWALRVTGVPVFREGNSFIIPSGEWSVVEECSGIRYLMASASAGGVFAHLYMRSARRRWAFFGLSVVVPIVANWLRAYLIVLLGHVSSNRLATGVDHVVYGWVFFGIVMLGLFVVGGRWADRQGPDVAPDALVRAPAVAGSPAAFYVVAVLALVAIASGPLWQRAVDVGVLGPEPIREIALPPANGAWQPAGDEAFEWSPRMRAAAATAHRVYMSGSGPVGVSVAVSRELGQGDKLLTFSDTVLSDYGVSTRTIARGEMSIPAMGADIRLIERDIRTSGRAILSWQWYRVGAFETGSVSRAKIALVWERIAGRYPLVGVVTVATYHDGDMAKARDRLRSFVVDHREALKRPLIVNGSGQ